MKAQKPKPWISKEVIRLSEERSNVKRKDAAKMYGRPIDLCINVENANQDKGSLYNHQEDHKQVNNH